MIKQQFCIELKSTNNNKKKKHITISYTRFIHSEFI